MSSVLTAGEYRNQLRHLLARCQTSFTDEEQGALRLDVREQRNRRPNRAYTPASAAITREAAAIVQLLEGASRVLRPRETQELDDLVAGREPADDHLASQRTPVRLRRRGAG